MARRAQVVTRRILHRMYHQCGNTDTYLSPPPSSPPSSAPNPRRIASEPTNPLVHDLTLSPHPPPLPFIPPRFSPNSTRPNSFEISRHPFYDLHASLCLLFHAGGRKRERVGRCARLHVYRQRTRGRSWTSRRRRRFLVTRLC